MGEDYPLVDGATGDGPKQGDKPLEMLPIAHFLINFAFLIDLFCIVFF